MVVVDPLSWSVVVDVVSVVIVPFSSIVVSVVVSASYTSAICLIAVYVLLLRTYSASISIVPEEIIVIFPRLSIVAKLFPLTIAHSGLTTVLLNLQITFPDAPVIVSAPSIIN